MAVRRRHRLSEQTLKMIEALRPPKYDRGDPKNLPQIPSIYYRMAEMAEADKMKKKNRATRAWTGGSAPPAKLPLAAQKLAKRLLAEQVREFTQFWGDKPNADTMATFRRRARYDAWATYRTDFERYTPRTGYTLRKMKFTARKRKNVGSRVQTLLFSRKKFSAKTAKSWARRHGFKYGKVDAKPQTLRLRQLSPSRMRKSTFGTIPFGGKRSGIQAVVAVPRRHNPTFLQARAAILDALRQQGWDVKTYGPRGELKVPHATSSDGDLRLWFKPQAVHYTRRDAHGHDMGRAHTLAYDLDIRKIDPAKLGPWALYADAQCSPMDWLQRVTRSNPRRRNSHKEFDYVTASMEIGPRQDFTVKRRLKARRKSWTKGAMGYWRSSVAAAPAVAAWLQRHPRASALELQRTFEVFMSVKMARALIKTRDKSVGNVKRLIDHNFRKWETAIRRPNSQSQTEPRGKRQGGSWRNNCWVCDGTGRDGGMRCVECSGTGWGPWRDDAPPEPPVRRNHHLRVGGHVRYKGKAAIVVKTHPPDSYTIRFTATNTEMTVEGSQLKKRA
jgi:hypothetical protein